MVETVFVLTFAIQTWLNVSLETNAITEIDREIVTGIVCGISLMRLLALILRPLASSLVPVAIGIPILRPYYLLIILPAFVHRRLFPRGANAPFFL